MRLHLPHAGSLQTCPCSVPAASQSLVTSASPQNIAVVSAEEVCPVTEIYIAASLSHSLETRLQLVCIQCNGQVHSSTHIETITQCVRLK